MEELKSLYRPRKVAAPPDFEQRVMAELSLRKRSRRQRTVGLSLAGAFAALAAIFILVNIFILENRAPDGMAGLETGARTETAGQRDVPSGNIIQVTEPLDYLDEVRRHSPEPRTVYLLEQVSNTTYREIKY